MARGKPPKRKPRARAMAPAPRRDPAQEIMEEMAEEMLEILHCPVLVAEDHADRLSELALDAEQGRDLAVLGARLHAQSPMAPLIGEVAATLDRHARELASLADRLMEHTSHDTPHAHVEPDDDAVREMLVAMFADPSPEHET